MRDDRERLRDILEAIAQIERYSSQGRSAFAGSDLIQTWMVHHLQIIGEAATHVGPTMRGAFPQIPWAQMVALRNILVHEYFGVDLDEVWNIVEQDMPALKREIEICLRALG